MEDMEGYFWETIYIIKQLHDHGCDEAILRSFGNQTIDGDSIYELGMGAIDCVFECTRHYYNELTEIETIVFFDPAFDEFCRLCTEYEKKLGIKPKDNCFRTSLMQAFRSDLTLNDYSYDYLAVFNNEQKGRPRLILKLYVEFCCHYEIPGCLLEAKDSVVFQTKRLQEKLQADSNLVQLTLAESDERMAA